MKSGTVYMPNTARQASTATAQPSQRSAGFADVDHGEDGGFMVVVGCCVQRYQAGCGAWRWMGLSLTGRFTRPANTPSPMAMYQTIS